MDNAVLKGCERQGVIPKRGFWKGVSKKNWKDWRWQLRNRVTGLEELEKYISLHPDELAGVKVSRGKLAMSITPYWMELMDKEDPRCPIRRQVVPHIGESYTTKHELVDPCGEDNDSPVPGLVHRYPDRVLLIITDKCASYCRFCTRKRIVSEEEDISIEKRLADAIVYIKKNKQIRDVLVSGGDPLMLSDNELEYILSSLRKVPQIEILRIGTRIPITLPQRITPALVKVLARYHPLWMNIHINHPIELTIEVKEACGRIVNKGIPLGSQTVLLRGINDSEAVMKRLIHDLLTIRIRPYYLYQCDPVLGSSHFRTPVSKGIEIIKTLRGFTTGFAVPTYVVDAPGGGGKVPLGPDYIVRYEKGKLVVRNFKGKVYEYHEPPSKPSRVSAPSKEEVTVA